MNALLGRMIYLSFKWSKRKMSYRLFSFIMMFSYFLCTKANEFNFDDDLRYLVKEKLIDENGIFRHIRNNYVSTMLIYVYDPKFSSLCPELKEVIANALISMPSMPLSVLDIKYWMAPDERYYCLLMEMRKGMLINKQLHITIKRIYRPYFRYIKSCFDEADEIECFSLFRDQFEMYYLKKDNIMESFCLLSEYIKDKELYADEKINRFEDQVRFFEEQIKMLEKRRIDDHMNIDEYNNKIDESINQMQLFENKTGFPFYHLTIVKRHLFSFLFSYVVRLEQKKVSNEEKKSLLSVLFFIKKVLAKKKSKAQNSVYSIHAVEYHKHTEALAVLLKDHGLTIQYIPGNLMYKNRIEIKKI